jgi:hypothetical protein
MPDQPTNLRIERLTTIKSAFLVEARSAKAQGLDTPAMALFVRAAEMELELAELFLARDEGSNPQVSWRSAGFSLPQALIDLLVKKNVIEAGEWAEAMKGSCGS